MIITILINFQLLKQPRKSENVYQNYNNGESSSNKTIRPSQSSCNKAQSNRPWK